MALALTLSAAAGLAAPPMKVNVYNYAQIPREILGRAEESANRVFRHAGVELEWRHCKFPGGASPGPSACQGPMDPTVLVLRLLPQAMVDPTVKTSDEFGKAMVAGDGGFGFCANVFFHRVEELVGKNTNALPEVVGLIVAHELGHLLLGSNSHFRRGVMRGHWGPKEVERAAMGNMGFTPAQARRICQAARERALAARPLEAGAAH
jgi:hypothetical protein